MQRGEPFPRGVIFPSNSCYEPYIISKELHSFGVHRHTHTHLDALAHSHKGIHTQLSTNFLSVFLSLSHTHTHTLSSSRFALPVSISCHLKSRTAGASGSRWGARLTGNGPHSLIRLPCSCPSSATPRMSSPGGRGLVECEEGEEVRWGEREREREHPMGSLLPDSLKGALFQQERKDGSRGAVRSRLSLKKGAQGPGELH